MDYKSLLLNDLLTKYENSAHFLGVARVNRRVLFTFNKKSVPAYFAGDRPQVKAALHQTVKELEKQGILVVEWIPGEKNNLLRRVSLNLNKTEEAYAAIGRTPRMDQLVEVNRLVEDAASRIRTHWIREFLLYCQDEIIQQLTWPALLPKERPELELLLGALKGLDVKGDEDMLERVFSIRYLGGSKLYSKKVKTSLIAIVRCFFLTDSELSDEDILYELGIIKTTEELLLSGPLIVELQGQRVDLSPFAFGAVLDTQAAHELKIVDVQAKRVLLVENKTNFHYLTRKGLPPDMLLIYLGGFPGPRKRLLLAKIYDFCRSQRVSFWHWGDIDWGGFRIFMFLRENVMPSLCPVYMDEKTLLACRDMTENISLSYRSKLVKLRENPKYACFFGLIDLMLELNIKLEQEALLADKNLNPADIGADCAQIFLRGIS